MTSRLLQLYKIFAAGGRGIPSRALPTPAIPGAVFKNGASKSSTTTTATAGDDSSDSAQPKDGMVVSALERFLGLTTNRELMAVETELKNRQQEYPIQSDHARRLRRDMMRHGYRPQEAPQQSSTFLDRLASVLDGAPNFGMRHNNQGFHEDVPRNLTIPVRGGGFVVREQ